MRDSLYYINKALEKAKIAAKNGDVPVGCVLVNDDDKIIASSYNKRNKTNNATAHAEIIAISNACKKIKDFRLENMTMYVTLEPCQMCAGAIVQSRIPKLIIGVRSLKSGSCGSIINILDNNEFNHKVEVTYLDDENCKNILKDFFKKIRKKNGRKSCRKNCRKSRDKKKN